MTPLPGRCGDWWSPKRTHTITKLSSEEVIPRLEAVMICGLVADVELIERVVGHAIVALDGLLVERFLAQPAIFVVREDICRLWRGQKEGPFI